MEEDKKGGEGMERVMLQERWVQKASLESVCKLRYIYNRDEMI